MLTNRLIEMLENWPELVDLTIFGLKTHLHELSHNGPELVTNAWLVRSLKFITQVITDNIAMWVIRRSIVDWDCSKTLTLLATSRTRNQPGWSLFYVRKPDIRSYKLDV